MQVINNIEYLNQRDERWSMEKIGRSNTTLGRYGCTTTALAMLTDYFGCKKTPLEIAQTNDFYDDGGNMKWTSLSFPTFSFRWREGNLFFRKQEFVNLEIVKAWLAPNPDRACLLEVANGSHWVVGLWWNEYDQDILAIDPWTGMTCNVFQIYGNITGASLFVRSTKNEWRGKKQPEAPNYN